MVAPLPPRTGDGSSTTSMVPRASVRPDVLPTDRLLVSGKPVREIRDDLRRIANVRNVGQIALAWGQVAVTMGAALYIGHPLAWVVGFVFMGAVHARFAAIMHEAAHKLMFTNKALNDFVGRWLSGYPTFAPMDLYRRGHFAHHKDEFGPNEPDMPFYEGYPVPPSTLRRRLWRDLRGNTGWKNLRPLLSAARSEEGFGVARKILLSQVVLAVVLSAAGIAVAGPIGLLTYPVLWLGSWMTIWKVINRLRSIAEHGGMQRSRDRRCTTHNVRQSWLARFWVVPMKIGWHLAHHVDMGVPWRNLPALHEELVASGWITDEITYRSYLHLWRTLASAPE